MSTISMVVATDLNGIIGREDRIPWRLRDDLIHLKDLTLDRVVILGRKTYDSMAGYYHQSGRQMPGMVYIVITHNKDYQPIEQNTIVAHSIDEALLMAESIGEPEIMCNGGGSIYAALLPFTQRIYLTEVKTEAGGDAKFPDLPTDEWREVSREPHRQDDRNEFDFDFVLYERLA